MKKEIIYISRPSNISNLKHYWEFIENLQHSFLEVDVLDPSTFNKETNFKDLIDINSIWVYTNDLYIDKRQFFELKFALERSLTINVYDRFEHKHVKAVKEINSNTKFAKIILY